MCLLILKTYKIFIIILFKNKSRILFILDRIINLILYLNTFQTLTEFLLTDVSRPPRLKIVNNEYIDINPEGFDIAKENFKQNLSTNIGFQENEGSQVTKLHQSSTPSELQ